MPAPFFLLMANKPTAPRERDAKGRFIAANKPQQSNRPAPKQKDPAKVRAGKIRAAKALRDSAGKLTSNNLAEIVRRDAQAAGIESAEQVTRFFQQNERAYKHVGAILTTSRDTERIKKDLKDYRGRVFLNDEKTTKARAAKELSDFQNFVKTELDAKTFLIFSSYSLTIDGKLNLLIPPREIWETIAWELQSNGHSEILEDYEINFVKS